MDRRSQNRQNEHLKHGWVEATVVNSNVHRLGQKLMQCPEPCGWLGWVDAEATSAV